MSEPRTRFVKRVARAWWEDDVVYLASAITFDALVAAIPLLMLVLALSGWIVTFMVPGGQLELLTFLRGAFPRTRVVDLDPLLRVEQLLVGVADRRGAVSLLSLPLLVLFATRMFATLRWGLDRVFDAAARHRRPLPRQWQTDMQLLLITGFFLVANGVTSLGLTVMSSTTGAQWVVPAGAVVTWASALGLFVLVFKIAPARHVDWSTAFLAGVLMAVAFEIGKYLFGFYVQYVARLDTMTADAQAAGLLLVLAWLYVNALMFLTVGEVANELKRGKMSAGH